VLVNYQLTRARKKTGGILKKLDFCWSFYVSGFTMRGTKAGAECACLAIAGVRTVIRHLMTKVMRRSGRESPKDFLPLFIFGEDQAQLIPRFYRSKN
jgi:hypothetical protein